MIEAVMFLKEWKRICYECTCAECPLSEKFTPKCIACDDYVWCNPEEAVAIVEQWSKEHPMKNYAQDFFEKFPDARKTIEGIPFTCKMNVYGGECKHNCTDCWNESMEE